MLVAAVTHPDAGYRSPRGLSEGGRMQALLAARRIRDHIGRAILRGIVSSPRTRCLETAIVVARELGETMPHDAGFDAIHVALELDPRGQPISRRAFEELVLGYYRRHDDLDGVLLVAVHELSAIAGPHDERPVIAVFEIGDRALEPRACERWTRTGWASCT